MLVYVRPSNEVLLRARVPGAQDQRRSLKSISVVRVPRAGGPPGSIPILLRPRIALHGTSPGQPISAIEVACYTGS